MTDQEINVEIAEACGFERLVLDYESLTPENDLQCGPDGIWRTPSANKWLGNIVAQRVQCVGNYFVRVSDGQIFADFDGPDSGTNGRGQFDYTTDLNAMYEAENMLHGMQTHWYAQRLGLLLWDACHATARQRAEAFLRTLRKWRE